MPEPASSEEKGSKRQVPTAPGPRRWLCRSATGGFSDAAAEIPTAEAQTFRGIGIIHRVTKSANMDLEPSRPSAASLPRHAVEGSLPMSVQSVSADSCYQSEAPFIREVNARDFEPGTFDRWLERLADQGSSSMLMSLLLKLERLHVAPLEAPRRLDVMHRLMAVVRNLSRGLPRTSGSGGGLTGAQSGPLSLEQRLWCLSFKNLKQTLEALDVARSTEVAERDYARLWLVHTMLSCLDRQLELSMLRGWPLPPNTWQEAHDLYAYHMGRLQDVVVPGGDALYGGEDLDADSAYKRLLIIGLIAEQGARKLLARVYAEAGLVADWARESVLQDPKSYSGVLGSYYLVEVSQDAPPRWMPGAPGSINRAWVLCLPRDLLIALEAEGVMSTGAEASENWPPG